jgi:hypothetical protein
MQVSGQSLPALLTVGEISRKVGGTESQSVCLREEKILASLTGLKTWFVGLSTLAISRTRLFSSGLHLPRGTEEYI